MEKQKYPSQINTKTIACRISSSDYVQFLQDAISKGITLNDWLLMKIYNKSQNQISSTSELVNSYEPGNNEIFPITFENDNVGELTFENEDDIIFNFNDLLNKYYEQRAQLISVCKDLGILEAKLNHNIIDLTKRENRRNLGLQLTSYLRTVEYEDQEDQKEDIREFRKLFKELFLDED